MAKKISELTALTTPASADLLAIVDIGASTTKKITRVNLFGGGDIKTDITVVGSMSATDLVVSSDMTLGGSVRSDLDVMSTLHVASTGLFDGTLTAAGSMIALDIVATDDITIGGDLTLAGSILSDFDCTGTLQVAGTFTAEGSVVAADVETTDLQVTGTVRGDFSIEGEIQPKKFAASAASGAALTSDHFGMTFSVDFASNQHFTLPSVDAGDLGAWFRFIKLGAGHLTVIANDSDTIADSAAAGSCTNSVSAEDYATLTLQLVNATEWVITGAHGTWDT